MGFQQGLSGLNASSKSLEVIGNNIANASTIGAKVSRAEFADVYANAVGASKALNAAMLSLNGSGNHHVSFDAVIRTMKKTGADMRSEYKETSLGGLAMNVSEPLC